MIFNDTVFKSITFRSLASFLMTLGRGVTQKNSYHLIEQNWIESKGNQLKIHVIETTWVV